MPYMTIPPKETEDKNERLYQLFKSPKDPQSLEFCYEVKGEGKEPGFFTMTLKLEALKALPGEGSLYLEMQAILAKQDPLPELTTFLEDCLQSAQEDKVRFIHKITQSPEIDCFMYKMDYKHSDIKQIRVKSNKLALKEFVLTRIARAFSDCNQTQELALSQDVNNNTFFLLKCGIIKGLQNARNHLLGANQSPYHGILVDSPNSVAPHTLYIADLGLHFALSFSIFNDVDSIGTRGQNMGWKVKNDIRTYAGFDHGNGLRKKGKFERWIVDWINYPAVKTLRNDFSYQEDSLTKHLSSEADTRFGLGRHLMYRNFSVFKNCAYIEKLAGVHLLRALFEGKLPEQTIVESYEQKLPGFTNKLYYILDQADDVSSPIDCLFEQLENEVKGLQNIIAKQEVDTYLAYIEKIKVTVKQNYQDLLEIFNSRLELLAEDAEMVDMLEKLICPKATTLHNVNGECQIHLDELNIPSPNLNRLPMELSYITLPNNQPGFKLKLTKPNGRELCPEIKTDLLDSSKTDLRDSPLEVETEYVGWGGTFFISHKETHFTYSGTLEQLDSLREQVSEKTAHKILSLQQTSHSGQIKVNCRNESSVTNQAQYNL